MKRILESSKYIVVIGVLCLLVAAFATFAWGVLKTWGFLTTLIITRGADSDLVGPLIELVDIFLVGTVLMITALGLYELFIGKLNLPAWLIIDDLAKLKSKLTDVIVLILAIHFLKFFLESKDMMDTLLKALAAAVVIAVLIAFSTLRVKEPKEVKELAEK